MTGPQPSRGGLGDPWRGGRPATTEGSERARAARGDAELEELSVRAVIRQRRGGVGATTLVAAVALVTLLAAGFGALGGRPERAPDATVVGPVAIATSTSDPARTRAPSPLVTPASPCGPLPPEGPPGVMLQVGDHLMAAGVEVVDSQSAPPRGPDREPIEIPADAIANVRIAAGACATGWHIAIWSPSDGQLYPVDIVPNPGGDPTVALQNEFALVLTPLRSIPGDVLELRAALQIPGRNILARWPFRFLPFERPKPRLLVPDAGAALAMVEGCDVVLTFNNGYRERRLPCPADLSTDPPPAARLAPGTALSLDFDGWSIGDTIASCGANSERTFVLMPVPDCEQHPPHGQLFAAPSAGDWTMEIAACAIKDGNRICGTWYVDLDTR